MFYLSKVQQGFVSGRQPEMPFVASNRERFWYEMPTGRGETGTKISPFMLIMQGSYCDKMTIDSDGIQ